MNRQCTTTGAIPVVDKLVFVLHTYAGDSDLGNVVVVVVKSKEEDELVLK